MNSISSKISDKIDLDTSDSQVLNIYGFRVKCLAHEKELLTKLLRPFKYFKVKNDIIGNFDFTINIKTEKPDYSIFPPLSNSFSTPRNIVYSSSEYKVVDYFGKGVVVEESEDCRFLLISSDINFLQEAFYLLIMSLFGKYCDRNKMMRIHALCLSYKNVALLLPMPPGSGKSTMAMALLQNKNFKLISDDEPILKRDGKIYPFPIRIGTLDSQKIEKIPSEFVYEINRMEFGKKYFIDYDFWGKQLEQNAHEDYILLVGRRILNGRSKISETSKTKAMKTVIRDAVIGIGLYQGVEFVFKNSPWEILKKISTALMRLKLAFRMVNRSSSYEFILSQDISENVETLERFLESKLDK